jgi:hypothetical protein
MQESFSGLLEDELQDPRPVLDNADQSYVIEVSHSIRRGRRLYPNSWFIQAIYKYQRVEF